MSKKCIGCGSNLQTTNKEKQGYIKQEKYETSSYCERCFKIIHYNEKIVTTLENVNEYILETINKKAKYVYFLIDFLNINSETINTFKKINTPKTLIISKLDIIPKSIKDNKIINLLKEEYKITDDIIFQSTKKNINTKKIISTLENLNIKEAYITGYTNAGKSTLINKLIQVNNIEKEILTTSLIPNTTIDFISRKISEKISIIDSPGFTLKETLYKDDEFDLIKRINPKSFLKPTTFQVKTISIINIENKIEITSSVNNSFTFYISNDINIDRLFKKSKESNYTLTIPANTDLVIKGLGFINIKKACTLNLYIENKNLIEIRKSIFS